MSSTIATTSTTTTTTTTSRFTALHALSPPPAPPPGYVQLLLFYHEPKQAWWYLELPIAFLANSCNDPKKMLKFFAVYIPLVETCGIVVHDLNWDDGFPIRAGQVWRVVDHSQPPKWPPADDDGNTVLNLSVVRPRSKATSSAGSRPPDFREDVKRRDGNSCAFTDRDGLVCQAAHLVYRHIGNPALGSILERTLEERSDKNLARITDIDDPDLGIFMRAELSTFYDAGSVSIMATPNLVLGTDDIPPSPPRTLPPTKGYPADGRRYTAQWVTAQELSRTQEETVAANTDAAFAIEYMANTPASPPGESNADREDASAENSASDNESDPDYENRYNQLMPDRNAPVNLPSKALCLYRLVSAVVLKWGKNNHCIAPPNPPHPPPTQLGPPFAARDRSQSSSQSSRRSQSSSTSQPTRGWSDTVTNTEPEPKRFRRAPGTAKPSVASDSHSEVSAGSHDGESRDLPTTPEADEVDLTTMSGIMKRMAGI